MIFCSLRGLEVLKRKRVSMGLPFLFGVHSCLLREGILLVLWGQDAENIEQFRSAALVHWSFNILFLSFCHQYGQDLKYKNFSQQPSWAETTHTSGFLATPVRNGGSNCPGKGCGFSSAQTLGNTPSIRPLGTIF